MKKNYLLAGFFVCFFFALKLSAQLNGAYTINNTLPSSASNFTSFTAFSASLNASGVSGPVTVNVMANTVFNEQINFNQAVGVSSTNTITINGNGSTITYNATVATLLHTVLLSGADYMTFNNLNFIGTGPTYALTVHLWSSADNNTFNNCTFDSPIVGTVTTLCPFSVSGTSVSPAAAGLCGNNNTVKTSTITGGYYGTAFYGNTATPFNTGNSILNSTIKDFYQSGCYNVYCQSSTFKGNIIERQNRLAVTTTYGIFCTTGSINTLIDGNFIRKLFNNIPVTTVLCYPIYVLGAATLNNENVVRNNVISDINSNGGSGNLFGIYINGGAYCNVYHNTISLDDNSATSGTTYGIDCISPNCKIKNNIITISRGGSGLKYGLYTTAAGTVGLQSDYNVINMTSITGTGNLPFFFVSGYTLANWQLTYPAYDQGSKVADPMYNNPGALDYVPTSTVINNMCPFIGVITDFTGFVRSNVTPDPGAYEIYTTPCAGSAGPNSVITPTYVVCPNTTLNIGLANTFTNTGYTLQWLSSTNSAFGPFTAITGATLPSFNTGLLSTTIYYSVLITCVNSSGTVTATSGTVLVSPQTINNVPYYEGFEGINFLNELPNCSWYTPPGGGVETYFSNGSGNRYPKTGTKFGSFASTSAGPDYVYSNGINLLPGVTYSAALWYINESIGYYPWKDISILVGTSQTTTGLSSIISTTASTFGYSLLSNTFTVSTAGIYYIAVSAKADAGSSPYLSWDDLSVTIPCQLNSPQLFVNSLGSPICNNKSLVFTASGADAYEWTSNLTGTTVISTSPVTIVSPTNNTTYYVTGTNTLSGCTSSLTQVITVLQAPVLAVSATSLSVCKGQSSTISVQGANSYNWAHGAVGAPVTVTPSTTTTYTVIGVAANGCSEAQTIVINVNAIPTVSAVASSYQLCKGDDVTLTGSGASSYRWSSNASLVQFGNPLVMTVQSSGGYTMTGTAANGCSGNASFVIDVDECTGINELVNNQNDVKVYPNPTTGIFNITANGAEIKSVDVFDLTGRIVFSDSMKNNTANINVSQLPNGVYSIKVKTGETVKYLKIIKSQ
ncbi:T9SS type A sorting domain-containing protein [Aurantibacillus circumpalustris]|uniref:T9SS type A sorting domain-containing protein n=1 Tax=Aurantibacillus circumpalustris TaxID=3036359 RepID=UPI00295B2589|nr:T9SS type A sorting domain-containing protein [Aurantibacillus circumpalustris]